MNLKPSPRHPWTLVALVVGMLTVSACSAGSLGSSDDEGGGTATDGGEAVSLSFLIGDDTDQIAQAEALVEAFTQQHPDVAIELEQRPGGSEGDNIVKTRLATGDMNHLFIYNTGSLFQAIDPQRNLVPLTDEEYVDGLDEVFTGTVTAGGDVFGAPFGAAMGGGVLYNRAVYEQLGLEVPLTWDEFMANNAEVKAAGIAPVIQTYQETWTSQLFVLGDFHNVAAADPDWAEKYTANQVKYAEQPALRGFEHLQEVHDAGYMNEDFASAELVDGLRLLATGEGAHYPILTAVIALIAQNHPDELNDIGFFPLPGDDAATNGLTVWTANGVYVPTTTEGAELEATKEFLAFIASAEGCEVQASAVVPIGPYQGVDCALPDDVPAAVSDLVPYIEEGNATPALEFLSPVKGPALEQITVEVGSGIRSAKDGAALYDEDVEKQAQQLGLEGW